MTSSLVEPQHWSRRRWWGAISLVFLVQLALIFWLGDTRLVRPRPAAPGFTFRLAGSGSAGLLALRDPTWFVLPHPQGFRGPVRAETRAPELRSPAWLEWTNRLLLPAAQPGAAFNRFVESNDFSPPLRAPAYRPELALPNLPPLVIAMERSSLRLASGLAHRRLLTPPQLPSWTNSEILTDTVVQVLVDADGRPVSVTLLSSSGYQSADQYALDQAKAARFDAVGRNLTGDAPDPASQLSWGRMVFRWHTIPTPPANAPTAMP